MIEIGDEKMIFEETFDQNNKQISYIRYGEWTEKIIRFFHGFTGSKMKKKDVLCVRISISLKMQSSIPLPIMDWVCIMTHMH